MKAPRHLRYSSVLLISFFIFLQYGCEDPIPGPQVNSNCCPGNAGILCTKLTERLQSTMPIQEFNDNYTQDDTKCPIVKGQWIVQIDSWCNWPLKSPVDSFISTSSWNKVMDAITKSPCITLIDSATNKEIVLDSLNQLAITKICPCDSTLIVLDTTKLNNQEMGAVASSKGGPQGNNVFMLPEIGENIFQGDYELGVEHSFDPNAGRKIAIIDSGVDAAVAGSMENQFVEKLNIIRPGSPIDDEYGHGTAVLSIVEMASRVDNNESNHKYIIYKTFDEKGVGTMFDVVCALHGAMKEADMVNMSWGTSKRNKYLEKAIDSFDSKATPLIASKGNDCLMTTPETPQNFPADFETVYDVAALNLGLGVFTGNSWTSFIDADPSSVPNTVDYWECSNWRNDSLQLIAPGKIDFTQGVDRYGTSFAAAYVSGIIARYYFENNTYPRYTASDIMNYTQHRTAAPNDGITRYIWVPTK
ncbi:MAG: S8/S53 family peptidase [Saprospiraceae bacterium]|nr:S8/S53 family peptidase [Saprospiraceae bacterium]